VSHRWTAGHCAVWNRLVSPVSHCQKIDAIPAFTKFIRAAALYSMTPCTKEVAMAVIKRDRVTPATLFAMPAMQVSLRPRKRGLPTSGGDWKVRKEQPMK